MGGQLCKRKKKVYQTGSILDRVISQASNQDQCLLYKLANYKKGGELIEAYNVGGQIEVEKLIKEQFGVLMYADGKGQIINRAEYLRWKFRDHDQVVLPIEASLSPHDPLAKWMDHEACWQMQYRGSLGETLLHVLIICDTKMHTRLARTLLKCFPKLAMDVVEGEEYLGASALHLAIAYFNNELVQDLVEAGANVNQRAIGSFFLPRDQQRLKPAKQTEYEGLAYLGEFPLAWAACCANESVYNLLLDSGAHPDYQDNFGNMILHMVVVCDKLDMFGYALRHPKLPAKNGIVNKAGLTPLTLACKLGDYAKLKISEVLEKCLLGRAEVFREMLELSAKEFWRYSNITCSAYPLNALDTILPDGRTNWNSALFIILNGTKEAHLDMLDGGIIQRLLEEKWKTFARNQFLKRLLILFIHLVCLSLAVYLRPNDPDEPLLSLTADTTVICRTACEIGTLLGVLSYVILQQGDEIKNQGLMTFLKQQSHAPAKAVFLISNLLILACIPFRMAGDKETEEAILLFAVPGSWFYLMFFAGAVRLTGPFVTMIYSMITGDMLTFGIIYTVVLFGFSQSFYFLYKGHPSVESTLYSSYSSTWMALFQITLGDYNYAELTNTTYPSISKTVFALFVVFVPILLLNMLIAMMGNTYAHVIEQSEKEWMKQWAKIVVTLERAVAQADLQHYLQEYSIQLGPGDDPSTEQRGVMVIKSKSKTRAKQRKGAVCNWKRVGKVTISALKKRGMTGEQMRCLMWGRESISTPVKTGKGAAINPLGSTNGVGMMGVFGEVLSSALDVMGFPPDVAVPNANVPLIMQEVEKPKADPMSIFQQPQDAMLHCNGNIKSDSSAQFAMLGALNQMADAQEATKKPAIKLNELYEDPMRELVHICDNNDEDDDKLQKLAARASDLNNVEEINVKNTPSPGCLKNLAGIFAGTDSFVKKVEETARKKYALLDPSDSDGFWDIPILGTISRTRRAKSASIRNTKTKNTDREKLCKSDTDSSFSEEGINAAGEGNEKDTELEYATNRINSIKQTLKSSTNEGKELKKLMPAHLELASRESKHSSSDSVSPHSSTDETEKVKKPPENTSTKKKKPKPRPKTAKNNRVSPAPKTDKKRSKSAKVAAEEKPRSSTPPDPLEPWSVQGIENMNTIMAWENEQDEDI